MDKRLLADASVETRHSDMLGSAADAVIAGVGWVVVGLMIAFFLTWALLLGDQLAGQD